MTSNSIGYALARAELIRALTAYSGITTADGAADGTTLVDSNLINRNDFISEKTILIMSGDAKDEDKGALSFEKTDGKIVLQGTGFSTQIKAGTIFRVLNFGRLRSEFIGTHTHALLVVHDASSLDADLDAALRDWLLDIGFTVTVCDPADVAANLEVGAFDVIAVSASCVDGDAGNLANLKEAEVPVVCFSAAIAVSAVFNMGATAGTEAAQTQIEITDNSPVWLIAQALGDLTVTASTTIYTMATKAANAVELGQEATGTGNDLTMVKLPQGEQDGGTPAYTPFFDRYFIGVGDFTNMNAVFKAILDDLFHHAVHEKRFDEVVVQVKSVYQEQIPDTDFSKTAIDTTLTTDPPNADAANSIVDLDQRVSLTYVLRSLWINTTNFGTGTKIVYKLWTLLNGAVTMVASVDVSTLGIQNLMDLFGLPEVHGDGIWITAQTDVGNTGACSGTYRYAEARK